LRQSLARCARSSMDRASRRDADAKKRGGRIETGGGRPQGQNKGFFFEPTVISGLPDEAMALAQENFGPVAAITPFSDKDEVFRFIWDNRKILNLREGAYSEVLSVRPCIRIGIDGFVLRETVAEYYQVARLTPDELKRRGIKLPKDYIEELKRNRRLADEDGSRDDGDSEATTPLYGGGVLVFDEYGRLKYHVSNDVFGAERQTRRLQYLWESGLLEAGKAMSRLRSARLSTIHRLRAIDARRFPAEGW